MIKKSILGALLALSIFTPAEAQSPPFNSYSIATLGGNCSTAAAMPYQKADASTTCTPGGVNGQALTLVGGVPQWTSLAGAGSVTSVAMSMPSIFSVSGSPITASGTLTATLASQSQNLFFASPNGSAGAPSFRAMVGADLPNPGASTLGGVRSIAPVASQWVNSISTSGVPSLSQPSFADLSGNAQKTTVNASSLLLGPDGLGYIPYGSFAGYNWNYTDITASHVTNANVGYTFALETVGSGAFGPATGDYASIHSARKVNHLTSVIDGEVDASYYITEQGRKGDTAGILGDVTKTKSNTADDTGGAIGAEWSARFVNTSGTTTSKVHALTAFLEDPTGVSGGSGYGQYNENWVGTNYAAYYAGNYLGEDATAGWQHLFIGASDRTTASQYFKIRGDKTTGNQRQGDIEIGVAAVRKTIRAKADNSLAIRNAADTGDLLNVSDNGVVQFPNDPAWASYTPTLSCGTGTLTSATAGGWYKQLGKTLHLRFTIAITTVGTCAGYLQVTLPAAPVDNQVFAGRDTVTGKMLQAITGTPAQVWFRTYAYDNTFPFINGSTAYLTGTIEMQ